MDHEMLKASDGRTYLDRAALFPGAEQAKHRAQREYNEANAARGGQLTAVDAENPWQRFADIEQRINGLTLELVNTAERATGGYGHLFNEPPDVSGAVKTARDLSVLEMMHNSATNINRRLAAIDDATQRLRRFLNL